MHQFLNIDCVLEMDDCANYGALYAHMVGGEKLGVYPITTDDHIRSVREFGYVYWWPGARWAIAQ